MTSLWVLVAFSRRAIMTVKHDNILMTSLEESENSRQYSLQLQQVLLDGTLGELEGEVHLEIDETVNPVQLTARRVQILVKDELIQEFQRMEAKSVIQKVEKPTTWVSVLVVVDPKPFYKALRRCYYPMTTIHELLPQLTEAMVFSVCDVKSDLAY